MTSTTYSLGEEMKVTGTRTSYDMILTKLQPTVEYKQRTASSVVTFDINLAEGISLRPTEISISAVRYGTSGGYLDLVWEDSEGKETTLATGIHAADKANDEASVTTKLDLSEVSLTKCTGSCRVKIYVYKLSPSKEMGIANLQIGGKTEKVSSIGVPVCEAGNVIYYNLQGERIESPQNGQLIIVGKQKPEGGYTYQKTIYHQ